MNDFTLYNSLHELDEESIRLIELAADATRLAYAPYSNFCVGAAVLLANGTIVTGTNQENAAYPSGMCAERVALYTISSQYAGAQIKKMAVVAKRLGEPTLLSATACGSCRQVMLEFEDRQHTPYEVIMLAPTGQWIKAVSAASLLPFSFSGSSLKQH